MYLEYFEQWVLPLNASDNLFEIRVNGHGVFGLIWVKF